MSLWLIPVLLRIFFHDGLFQYLLKNELEKRKREGNIHPFSRERMFLLQYFFCVTGATILAVTLRQFTPDWRMAAVAIIGFFNGLAAYCQWRAIEIHQSKNAIFTIFDDLIAMGLAYILLNEGQHLNWFIGAGIALSVLSVFLFGINDYRRYGFKSNFMLYVYVAIYSIIWGIAMFAQKWFSYREGMGVGAFIFSWYAGAFTASIIVVLMMWRKSEKSFFSELKLCLNTRDIKISGALAACVIASIGAGYWALQLVPQNVAQPIWLIAQLIVTTFIGLYIMKEARRLDAADKVFMVMGLIGGIIIAINF